MYTPKCCEYIVTTKDMGTGVSILGYLRYKGYNEFEFQYADNPRYPIGLGGGMNDYTKIYGTEEVYQNLLRKFAPGPEDETHYMFCEQNNLPNPCPNIWKLFEAQWDYYLEHRLNGRYPLGDAKGLTVLFRSLEGFKVRR